VLKFRQNGVTDWRGNRGGGVVAENMHNHRDNAEASWTEVIQAYCDIMDDVMRHLSPAEQVVYQRLFRLSRVRQSPFTKCRYEDLARQCGLSLRTLQRALKGLKQKQLIKTVWKSHGSTTFTINIVSEMARRPAFLPRKRTEADAPHPFAMMRPPVYDAFDPEDRELFLTCKRSLNPQLLNDLTEEAVEWLSERFGGDPEAFSDELLRDKVDELVFRQVFGVDRRERYQNFFSHLYQQ
jgi:hypothetical protein